MTCARPLKPSTALKCVDIGPFFRRLPRRASECKCVFSAVAHCYCGCGGELLPRDAWPQCGPHMLLRQAAVRTCCFCGCAVRHGSTHSSRQAVCIASARESVYPSVSRVSAPSRLAFSAGERVQKRHSVPNASALDAIVQGFLKGLPHVRRWVETSP